MIELAPQDPDLVLDRFWSEIRTDARLQDLAALVPTDRALGIWDAIPLAPLVMAHLRTPGDQLEVLDALARAYARAAGLHFLED